MIRFCYERTGKLYGSAWGERVGSLVMRDLVEEFGPVAADRVDVPTCDHGFWSSTSTDSGLEPEYAMTLGEIADELGVSRTRVSQIEQGALRKLREASRWMDIRARGSRRKEVV